MKKKLSIKGLSILFLPLIILIGFISCSSPPNNIDYISDMPFKIMSDQYISQYMDFDELRVGANIRGIFDYKRIDTKDNEVYLGKSDGSYVGRVRMHPDPTNGGNLVIKFEENTNVYGTSRADYRFNLALVLPVQRLKVGDVIQVPVFTDKPISPVPSSFRHPSLGHLCGENVYNWWDTTNRSNEPNIPFKNGTFTLTVYSNRMELTAPTIYSDESILKNRILDEYYCDKGRFLTTFSNVRIIMPVVRVSTPIPTPTPVKTPNMTPIYPKSGGSSKNCQSNGDSNINIGGMPSYTVVGVYDFDDGVGNANLNIVLRPNNPNDVYSRDYFGSNYNSDNNGTPSTEESRLDRFQKQITVTAGNSNENLLIEGNTDTPFYDNSLKKESTSIITITARDANGYRNLSETTNDKNTTGENKGKDKYNSYEKKVIQDLDANTFDTDPKNPNNSTVSSLKTNGQAMLPSDVKDVKTKGGKTIKGNGNPCCVDVPGGNLYLPVAGVELKEAYDNLGAGGSVDLNIKITPQDRNGFKPEKADTIKLKLTKKSEGGNWEVECGQ